MSKTRVKLIDSNLVREMFHYVDGGLVWAVNKGEAKSAAFEFRKINHAEFANEGA